MLKPISVFLRSYPLTVIIWKIYCKKFKTKIPSITNWQTKFINKDGIEIGGPSPIFKSSGYLSLYNVVKSLDGVNFSNNTIWEGEILENDPFKFENNIGKQYICEGNKLDIIENEKYDFVLSCNNLEHIANPISTIIEWKRVIKTDGYILLILPNKTSNFDHKRPYTTIEHLIEDYTKKIGEDDNSHIEEVLKLHDLKRDPQAGIFSDFKDRCLKNIENRCLHHHVFSENLLEQLFVYCEMSTVFKYVSKTDIFILGIKK